MTTPRLPDRPCQYPDCKELIGLGGKRYCPKHRTTNNSGRHPHKFKKCIHPFCNKFIAYKAHYYCEQHKVYKYGKVQNQKGILKVPEFKYYGKEFRKNEV